ncbi:MULTISPECIES: ATP-binding protein [unclassified Streptomyces]|uniref:ATP-binding protein n=1 Tax=unclassified Streptomyces TaxID=2593676 RepID=UPI0011A85283|nr:ATP-binding protein [Streptomyces sp. BK340]TVZ96362.1 anti-sigma regulatory factor (Ser/Thr protein kinase) [Streptomyces sp. BK340]
MAAQLNTLLREACEHVCPLPPVTGAVPAVRRRVRAVLGDWDVPSEIVDDALLMVCELVTNAIVHALPPARMRLSWIRSEERCTLRVEVTDTGPALLGGRARTGIDPDEHGRGETIVHALATRHGIRVHAGGVTRWADLVAT